jgi:hypothetical protein
METKSTSTRKSFFSPRRQLKTKSAEGIMPVVKISMNGFLISANGPGIEFLEQLSSGMKVSSINFIVKSCKALLEPNCSIDLCYELNNMKYFFSAVAFNEAGYVGLYCFRKMQL